MIIYLIMGGALKRRLVMAAGLAVGASALVAAAPAEAASWAGQSKSGVAYESCTSSRTYNKVSYVTCIQHSSGFGKVRVAIRVSTSAKRSVTGLPYLKIVGRSHNVSAPSCSGTLASGAKKQCATSWLNATRIVQTGSGTVTISGSRRPELRVRGMHHNGKKQENAEKYCGPASGQSAIWTMKGSSPSQSTLASKMKTNTYGFTPPNKIAPALNQYKPSSVGTYHLYDFGSSGQSVELAFRQLYRSIDAGMPVVYLVDPSKLPWSSAGGTRVRHYIELHGYTAVKTSTDTNLNGGWLVDRFQVFDPASGSVRNITPLQLQRASVASDYIDDDMVFVAK
ncbi:C39 family peptidase [Actinoallomurus sp. NPDC052274]|uniref:C39 family peptidase n=1 Tax=Actinoallomurus sp. NPDC052274 TaxID=3155420 RepID=UPI00341782B0